MGYTAQDPALKSVDIEEIKRLIPHRYPFLFVDRMINMVPNESAVGIKNVSVNEPFFQGHFPSQSVFPGVLVIEAMAQAASILVSWSMDLADSDLLVYFMALDNTRFRRIVQPGDQLELHVRAVRGGGKKVWKFHGEAMVEGELAAEADFMAMIKVPPKEG